VCNPDISTAVFACGFLCCAAFSRINGRRGNGKIAGFIILSGRQDK
jgi:hypothetical protein